MMYVSLIAGALLFVALVIIGSVFANERTEDKKDTDVPTKEQEPALIREALEAAYGPCNAKVVFNPRGAGMDWRAVFTSVVNNLETISCNVFRNVADAKQYCYANGFNDNEIEVIETEMEWRGITEATTLELSMIEAAKEQKYGKKMKKG